jgi:hypothetical protein
MKMFAAFQSKLCSRAVFAVGYDQIERCFYPVYFSKNMIACSVMKFRLGKAAHFSQRHSCTSIQSTRWSI